MNGAAEPRNGSSLREATRMIERLKDPGLRGLIDGVATVGLFLLMVGVLAIWS